MSSISTLFTPKLPEDFATLEINKACKICLRSNCNLSSIFENDIDKMISEILAAKIWADVGHPDKICSGCIEDLKQSYILKKKYEFSNQLIKTILNEDPYENVKKDKYTQTYFVKQLYPCEKCNDKFEELIDLTRHRDDQHHGSPHECRVCGKDFKRFSTLKDHLGLFHSELGYVNTNECHICLRKFVRKDHLKRHLAKKHQNTNVKDEDSEKTDLDNELQPSFGDTIGKYEYSCQICYENFSLEEDLKIHECTSSQLNQQNFNDDSLKEPEIIMKEYEKLNKEEIAITNDIFEDNENEQPDVMLTSCNDYEDSMSVSDEKQPELFTTDDTKELIRVMLANSKKKTNLTPVSRNADGKFECETCKKTFVKCAHLRRHEVIHSTGPKPYSCILCPKTFSRPDHLKNHVTGFHADVRPFQCVLCNKAFTRKEHLRRHKEICSIEKSPRIKEKNFSCTECNRKFSTERYLAEHIKQQHDETREYACKFCELKVIGAVNFKAHRKKHKMDKPKQFLCSECGRSFTKLQYLEIHMRRHSGEKPFQCRYCVKFFPRPTDQYAHEKMHTGEKGYICSVCAKAFSTSYKLRVHMRIHTGEKPYKCTFCHKAFSQNNDLKAHTRRHTGERFYCNMCEDGFVQMYHLRAHKRQVHGIDEPAATATLVKKSLEGQVQPEIRQKPYEISSSQNQSKLVIVGENENIMEVAMSLTELQSRVTQLKAPAFLDPNSDSTPSFQK